MSFSPLLILWLMWTLLGLEENLHLRYLEAKARKTLNFRTKYLKLSVLNGEMHKNRDCKLAKLKI